MYIVHKIGLYGEYFPLIIHGKNRREVDVGYKIIFTRVPDLDQQLQVTVIDLVQYDSSQEIYEDNPFGDLGAKGWTLDDILKETYEILHYRARKGMGSTGD